MTREPRIRPGRRDGSGRSVTRCPVCGSSLQRPTPRPPGLRDDGLPRLRELPWAWHAPLGVRL